MLITNKNNTEYTETVKSVFNSLRMKYKNYSARISDMFQLLKDSFGLDKFDILEEQNCNNGPFISYLIDKQIDWMNGKDVNFEEIYKSIIETGDFSEEEKDIFILGNIEERIWAIFLVVCSPEIEQLN